MSAIATVKQHAANSWDAFVDYLYRNRPYFIIFGLILLFVLLFELPNMVVVIHSGELGVEYRLFNQGTVTDYLYPEGFHLLWPWNKIFVYNTRIQESKQNMSVLTNEGLEVEIDLSIRYHPEPTMIGVLHQTIGPDYVNKIAIPEVESAVRSSVASMTVNQLFTGIHQNTSTTSSTAAGASQPNTSAVESNAAAGPAPGSGQMQGQNEDNTLIGAINKAIDEAAKKYVLIDNVVVTRIKVPDYVQASIQKKIEQQQVDEALEFRLDQSRKEIAIATNEAQRNNTVKASLSPDLLKLRGIEATEKLAASPNTKVVIVGNGANSLPVILGSDK